MPYTVNIIEANIKYSDPYWKEDAVYPGYWVNLVITTDSKLPNTVFPLELYIHDRNRPLEWLKQYVKKHVPYPAGSQVLLAYTSLETIAIGQKGEARSWHDLRNEKNLWVTSTCSFGELSLFVNDLIIY